MSENEENNIDFDGFAEIFENIDANFENIDAIFENIDAILENIDAIFESINAIFDACTVVIPGALKEKLRKSILENQELLQLKDEAKRTKDELKQLEDELKQLKDELKQLEDEQKRLTDEIENPRPPRFVLIGNTGHGKSSLINAMTGMYQAKVSDTSIGTKETEEFNCKDKDGNVIYSVLDSRGINESVNNEDAEGQLLKDIENFEPDAVLYVHNCTERSGIQTEVKFLKDVCEAYKEKQKVDIPIFVVLTKADNMDPPKADFGNERKRRNIKKAVEEFRRVISDLNFAVKDVIPVSAYIDWGVDKEKLNRYTEEELLELAIEYDGRYNIDELNERLCNSLDDLCAQMAMATLLKMEAKIKEIKERVKERVKEIRERVEEKKERVDAKIAETIGKEKDLKNKFASKITHIFATIAGAVAAEPIPFADAAILLPLEGILVTIIVALSGRKASIKNAPEYLASLGVVVGVGQGLKLAASALKFIPFAGSVVNAGIAAGGVEALGNAARKYYIR